MTNPIVYLCGPINGCDDHTATGWREEAKTQLAGMGIGYRDPMDRDYRGQEEERYREIVELDKIDVRKSDALLVCASQPSVGTSMEVLFAHQLGKPVVVWVPDVRKVSPWLRYHATEITSDLHWATTRAADFARI